MSKRDKETQTETKRDKKGLRLPGNAHEDMGKSWADLPAFQRGQRGVFIRIRDRSDTMYATQRERGESKSES